MTGTLVNAAAIAAGGCVGLLLKKGVKGSHQDSINKALGVAVLVLGLNGVISSMFTVNADGTLASSGELLLIISLVLGTLGGEALRIDDRLNGLSGLVERGCTFRLCPKLCERRPHLLRGRDGHHRRAERRAAGRCLGAVHQKPAGRHLLCGAGAQRWARASSLPRCLFWYTREPFPFWRVRWNRSSRVNCWGRSAAWATAWCCASASTFSA